MSAPTCVFDGLNINDGAVYTVFPGVDLGERKKTFDEYRSFTGDVSQANVSEAYYVEAHLPIAVQGSSRANLKSKVEDINDIIDSCSAASTKTLVYDGESYEIAASPRVAYVKDQAAEVSFWTKLDLTLNRVP